MAGTKEFALQKSVYFPVMGRSRVSQGKVEGRVHMQESKKIYYPSSYHCWHDLFVSPYPLGLLKYHVTNSCQRSYWL